MKISYGITVHNESIELERLLNKLITHIKNEYSITEPDVIFEVDKLELPLQGLSVGNSKELIAAIESKTANPAFA